MLGIGLFLVTGCASGKKGNKEFDWVEALARQRPKVSEENRKTLAHDFFLRARYQERKGNQAVALSFYQVAFEYDSESRDLCFILVEKFKKAGMVDTALTQALECLQKPGRKLSKEIKMVGEIYLRKGDLRQALKHYEEAIAIQENDRELLYTMSTLYETLRETEKQNTVLKRLLPMAGYPLRLVEKLAANWQKEQKLDSVATLYQTAWDKNRNHRFGELLARVYDDQKMYSSLLSVLARLNREKPNQPLYRVQMARTHLMLEQPDSALALYQALAQENPEEEQYRFNVASLLYDQERYQEAQVQFEQLAQEYPENGVYHYFLGSIGVERNDEKLAESGLRKAIAIDSVIPEYWAKLAFFYVDRNQRKKALNLTQEMSERYRENWYSWYLRGVIANQFAYQADSQIDSVPKKQVAQVEKRAQTLREGAVKHFMTALKLDSSKSRVLFELGVTQEKLGRKQESIETLRQVVVADTNNAIAANYLGYLLVEDSTELELAIQLIDRALRIDPDNGAYLDSKGWWFYQMGRYEEARGYIEKAMKRIPDDTTIIEHFAMILEKLGEQQSAREQWRLILKIDPKHQTAQGRLR